MTESLIVVIALGFFAGFVFSVPIAGPISILITSNALKGNLRFCLRLAFGGALIEVLYVFIAVYGLTSLYNLYQKAIPIILIIGSVFLIFVSLKVFKTKLKLEQFKDPDKVKNNAAAHSCLGTSSPGRSGSIPRG